MHSRRFLSGRHGVVKFLVKREDKFSYHLRRKHGNAVVSITKILSLQRVSIKFTYPVKPPDRSFRDIPEQFKHIIRVFIEIRKQFTPAEVHGHGHYPVSKPAQFPSAVYREAFILYAVLRLFVEVSYEILSLLQYSAYRLRETAVKEQVLFIPGKY